MSQILFDPTQSYLAVQSHDRSVEIFRIRTEEEIRKKQARRRKRAKEKQEQARSRVQKHPEEEADQEPDQEIGLADLFTPYLIARASGKIRSFDFGADEPKGKGAVQLFMALSTNALEVYNIPAPSKSTEDSPEAARILSVDLPGHRADVRTLCLSSDDALLASASNGERLHTCKAQPLIEFLRFT